MYINIHGYSLILCSIKFMYVYYINYYKVYGCSEYESYAYIIGIYIYIYIYICVCITWTDI